MKRTIAILCIGFLIGSNAFNLVVIKGDTNINKIDEWNVESSKKNEIEEWNKTFGGSSYDLGYSIQVTIDNGYIITGSTMSFGSGLTDGWLIKTDSNGNEQWNKTFGGADYDEVEEVQQTTDAGYIIVGNTNSYGIGTKNIWLIKTDSNGNEQWNKTFGGADYDYGKSVQQTSDGGYIITGYTTMNTYPFTNLWLIKTDSDGNELWNETFGNPISFDRGYSLDITSDNGFIITGRTGSYGTSHHTVWLIKTDSSGNEQWNKTYSGYRGFSVQQTTDNGFIITGENIYDMNDVILIKTDSVGNEEWNKTFGDINQEDCGNEVIQTSDGGYILIGYMSSLEIARNIWVIKTDSNGNEQWNETFGNEYIDVGYSIKQTVEGGYIIVGSTCDNSVQIEDIWLIKIMSENNGPIADFTWDPQYPIVNEMVTFIDLSTDDEYNIINWTWDFGDENISYESNPTHSYFYPSYYYVCLNITNENGSSDEICKGVIVEADLGELEINQSIQDRGFPIRHALDGDWAGAQDWLPIATSTITKCEIFLRKFGTPEFNLTVELRTDGPEGPLLDTLVFQVADVSTTWNWFELDFADIPVSPETQYFIVCPPAPSGVATSFGYEWGYAFGNQYDDGSFWFTRDGGNLWRDLPTMYEMTFRTYGFS